MGRFSFKTANDSSFETVTAIKFLYDELCSILSHWKKYYTVIYFLFTFTQTVDLPENRISGLGLLNTGNTN